ncbi:hypothetical protein L1987_20154 [Smallanthus sonchifolius]|uniref:Uncharacterized protein n=1 Tax=Smallanthus sonchifolius TaxID=185202 RepID=A0ACB9ITZ3_9ASTR|nr:hypothetical protein L1987_20154 [Smallanthus sonchifolius]
MSDHVPVIEIPDTDTEPEVPPFQLPLAPSYDTYATSFQNTFQDISGCGNGWLWETDYETETTDELGHEAPVVEAQAADEPGHEAPATVEPIQTDSIAFDHSTRPSREIRIVYTRRKRKPKTGPSAEPEPKKAREDVPSTFEIGESSKARHDLTTDGEPVDRSVSTLATCFMRYEHHISSLQGSVSTMREMLQAMMGQLTFLEEDKVTEYDIRNQLHFRISDLESERAEMKKKFDLERQKVEAAEAGLVAAQQKIVTMGENVEAAVALATICLMMFTVMIRAGAIARFPH